MTKTYVRPINQNATDSHQTSPHWIITFVRFDVRDTFYFSQGQSKDAGEKVRNFLIVENDCIAVNVNTSKTNHTPQATVTLLAGDLNYCTAVHPGDFFTVNIVNFTEKAREIRTKITNKKPINKPGDGFKGVFKVNTVNKIITTNPSSGQKTLRYQVTGYAFTEFNHSIYYNAALPAEVQQNALLYQINDQLLEKLTRKGSIQEVLSILPTIILGQPTGTTNSSGIVWVKKFPYIIPKQVFQLLGIKNGKHAIDMYKIMMGIWTDFSTKTNAESYCFSPKYTNESQYQFCSEELSGNTPIQTSTLTNVSLLELMKRYSNELINEMYTCFRLDRETNSILPKLIIRQKPFTTLHGKHDGQKITKATRFLELPRWKVSPDLVYSINVARNESLRFNFVQITGTTGNPSRDGSLLASQASDPSSIKYDEKDINRHGLRPYVSVCNFDWPTYTNPISKGPYWTSLVFDWVYGGHLKLNGTIECVGLEENICIGDNLELQDTVYHIESISHTAAISPDGKKSFRTSLKVTEGYDKRSSVRGPVYPEMDFTDTRTDRINDYNAGYGILPGFSDTQDVLGRIDGEEVEETKERTFGDPKFKNKR